MWTYDNLTLRPIKVSIANIDTITQTERINKIATAYNFYKQMASDTIVFLLVIFKAIFQWKWIKSDFTNYDKKPFFNTLTYLQDKTNALAQVEGIFDKNTSLTVFNVHQDSSKNQNWEKTQLDMKEHDSEYLYDNMETGTIDIWMYFNGYVLSLAYSFEPNYIFIKGDDDNIWSKK